MLKPVYVINKHRAMDLMRKGGMLVKTFVRLDIEYVITPFRRHVSKEIADYIINQPDIEGGKDGLHYLENGKAILLGGHQTWRIRRPDNAQH